MKRVTLVLFVLMLANVAFSAKMPGPKYVARLKQVAPKTDQERVAKIAKIRKKATIDESYKLGSTTSFLLAQGEALSLQFKASPSGSVDVLFFEEGELVTVWWGALGANHADFHGVSLVFAEWPRDSRTINIKDSPIELEIEVTWKQQGGKSRVTFSANAPGEKKAQQGRKPLRAIQWDHDQAVAPFEIIMDAPGAPQMAQLRSEYQLAKVVAQASSEYEKLQLLSKWAHDRWSHSGSNKPSQSDPLTILKEASEGKQFRCVEYAIVIAAAARSLGMPSRVLALKRENAETANSGAGHVVAEVWLDQLGKWVFVDGQMDAIPEKEGVPLNAGELQKAIAQNDPGLRVQSYSGTKATGYRSWVEKYLYYFDFNLDQRFFGKDYDKRRYAPIGCKIMLVPKGAKNPSVFHRKTTIENCTYISNPEAFYPRMRKALAAVAE